MLPDFAGNDRPVYQRAMRIMAFPCLPADKCRKKASPEQKKLAIFPFTGKMIDVKPSAPF